MPPPSPDAGKVAGSLRLDGGNDYVAVPDDPGLDFDADDDLTIDAWIFTDSPLREPIVDKKDIAFNAPGYSFALGGGVLTFEMSDGTTTVTCNRGSGLADGVAWRFVAVTLDRAASDGLKLYIDGVFMPPACDPTPVGDLSNALPLSIGARPSALSGAMWWRGRLDEIEIFRRALTATQINELFVAGGAGKCPPEPQATPCDESDYATCGGDCPPGEICIQGPNQRCVCDPLPCGAQGDYPACDGFCPQGLVCEPVPGVPDCQCVQQNPACGDTFYPACNGACPAGTTCVNLLGSNGCECEPDPPACGDSLYPTCGGACPANEKCAAREAPVPGCDCTPCSVLGGSGLGGISVGWPATKDQLRWTGASECAHYFNVYRFTGARLPDGNGDGLADDYGSCFMGDIIGTHAPDPSPKPAGQLHWYLVTGENASGEGSLGKNSAGTERPNVAACP